MKKRELLDFNNALKSVSELKGVKFAYAVAKNTKVIKNEVEAILDAQKSSKEFQEYDNERIELCKLMAVKDESGKPKVTQNNFDIEDKEAFDKEFNKLKKKYKEAIEDRDKQLEEFNKLLEEEVKIKLHKVKVEELPSDITPKQLNSIFEMVID